MKCPWGVCNSTVNGMCVHEWANRVNELRHDAALEAARRVRDWIAAPRGNREDPYREWLREHLDDAALARIIGDTAAGEVMPSVTTDHPVGDSSRSGDHVAVGEEVSGVSTVNAEANPSASRDDQPSAPVRDPAKEAEPPRPSEETHSQDCKAIRAYMADAAQQGEAE